MMTTEHRRGEEDGEDLVIADTSKEADKRNQRREDEEGGKVSIVMPHAETAVCFTDTDTTISSWMKSGFKHGEHDQHTRKEVEGIDAVVRQDPYDCCDPSDNLPPPFPPDQAHIKVSAKFLFWRS
jgi:hypothetical protein